LYKKELKNVREVIFFKPIKGSNFVPFRVPLIVKNKTKLIKYLEKNKIQTREFFYPLDRQPAVKKIFKNNSSNKNFFKNSYYAYKNGLALPCYPDLRMSEIKYICNKIKNFYTFAK